ncbi:MAG: SRPBCC family protein [Anaerolineae bacterium]|nr:SRPBCC family protein [Anaerolineae bacterium]
MPYVEQEIVIDAPPEVVFDMIANRPEQMPAWWPPIEAQERVTPPPTRVGSRSSYVYKMMGVGIRGEHEVKEMTPNAHLKVTTISGIDSTFDFHFEPAGEGSTRLVVRVDYTLPGSFLGQMLNRLVIEKKNEEDLITGLQNLKAMLESGQ